MNREWSEKNKIAQQKLKKTSFKESISDYLALREILMQEMLSWKDKLDLTDYSAIPFINADGYHSKTVAYSIWHIIRIEDIVVNTLIKNEKEIFFEYDYKTKIGANIITTANELQKEEIAEFSQTLNIEALYDYAEKVKNETDKWLNRIEYETLKQSFNETDKNQILNLGVVSKDENAIWLIDYWCNKNVAGLLKMPLSRHWIMHIEASNRIIDKIKNH